MKTGVKTARLKETLIPADFPHYGSSYAIALAHQSKSELCFLHVMEQSITDGIVSISVGVYFEDTASEA